MINTKIVLLSKWRRVVVLSATFLFLGILISSCKKEKKALGEGLLPDGTSLSSAGVDTFALTTYSINVDSTQSVDPQFNLLGKYNDPETGIVDASFFTQISLSGFSPVFGDFDDIKVDSMILSFRYGGYYGTLDEMLFEVYELEDGLSRDSTYYYFSTVNTKAANLVPTENNEGLIKPDPASSVIVGETTQDPQLRIPIDTTFARNLMVKASESANNEAFFEEFKGFHIKVNQPTPAAGKGAVLYLNSVVPQSKMTTYYTINGEQFEFDFLISASAIDFNHMKFDRSGTPLDQVIENTELGQEQFFAQSFKARAKIEFPTVSNIDSDVVLHEATLELPISFYGGSDFYPSSTVVIAARLFEDVQQEFLLNDNVSYNSQRRAYIINLRPYIQRIINGEVINDGIVLSPRLFNTTAERIVFNGVNTLNKSKPRLNIVYTKF